jgi:hypothetical protein
MSIDTLGSAVNGTGNKIVDAIGQIHFEGRLIPHTWRHHPKLRTPAGKLYNCAIDLLADIVYWHRPTVHRDEASGRVTHSTKKFQADRYRIDYQQWADENGYTKRQAQDAAAFLKKQGICLVELDNYQTPTGHTIYSAVFITPDVDALIELNGGEGVPKIREGGHGFSGGGSRKTERGGPKIRERTVPKSTTQTSTKVSHTADGVRASDKSSQSEQVATQLIGAGLSPKDAARLIADVGADQCQRNLNPPGIGAAKNRLAYLKSAIRGDYAAGQLPIIPGDPERSLPSAPVPQRAPWQVEACRRVYESLNDSARQTADNSGLGRLGYIERFYSEKFKAAVADMKREKWTAPDG